MGQHRNGDRSSLSQAPKNEHHSIAAAREAIVEAVRAFHEAKDAQRIACDGPPLALDDAISVDRAVIAAEEALFDALDLYEKKRDARCE